MTEDSSKAGSEQPKTLKWQLTALFAAIFCLTTPFIYLQRGEYRIQPEVKPDFSFTGSKSCKQCHQTIYRKWQGSHHDLAMDLASEETVLGDFDNAFFTDPHSGVTSHFFRKDGGFFVETKGASEELEIFEITHTFGVFPLQQYLIPFPGGRLQCLHLAWDSRQGKWYRLPPYEVEGPSDWLHWTRGGQTWNGMCAECHSTALEKRFDRRTNSYDTRWFEIHVGCEACHGPGSSHVAWAEKPALARKQIENYGLLVDTAASENTRQIALCAPCHSRRYQLGDNPHQGGEVLDTMVPSLLLEGLYYPDGQIKEEVYVYGSFTQSKMYQHGVRCSDCHDSHSLALHSNEGNSLCLSCHKASSYDSKTHHFHKRSVDGQPSDGYLCVKCHMPGRVYMGVDYRPDHSLRIPRPDLSLAIGVPNSCQAAGCHQDKNLDWVNEHYDRWYGTARKYHYGQAFAAARQQQEASDELLAIADNRLFPGIVRATALSHLAHYPGEKTTMVLTRALEADDALLRHTAIGGLSHLDQKEKSRLLIPKLYDPVKAVRIEAAAALAEIPINEIDPGHRRQLNQGLQEYRAAMEYNSDFAPQRYNLGNLAAATGNFDESIDFYRQALVIDDRFFQAKVNLAMQLNQKGENQEAVALFKEVLDDHPELHQIAYSLGLLLAEMQEYQQAVKWLGQAADKMPEHSRARYNQALAHLKLQQWQKGEEALIKALQQEPANLEYFATLSRLYYSFGLFDKARKLAETTLSSQPDHRLARQLLQALEQK